MHSTTVILDTNVFVAAGFNPTSASAKIVDAVKRGKLRMIWNEATRHEIERIMQQIPPLRHHPTSDLFRDSDQFTAAIHPEQFAFIPDPEDRKFAALAHAARAVLITNDSDLLDHRERMNLPVFTPGDFERAIQQTNQRRK